MKMKYIDKKELIKALKDNPTFNIISQASSALRNDKEIILLAVSTNEKALKYASKNLQDDKEIVKEAIKKGYNAFEYASKTLKEDKDFILELIEINPWVLHWTINTPINDDKEVIIKALKYDKPTGNILHNANESLKNDKELIMIAVKKNGVNICFASEDLKNDKEVALTALKNNDLVDLVIKFLGNQLKEEIGENDPISYLEKALFYDKLNNEIENKETNNTKKLKI